VTSLSVVIFGRGIFRLGPGVCHARGPSIFENIYIYMDRPTDVETGRSSLIGLRFDIVGREYA
jgi:hypothetical protein